MNRWPQEDRVASLVKWLFPSSQIEPPMTSGPNPHDRRHFEAFRNMNIVDTDGQVDHPTDRMVRALVLLYAGSMVLLPRVRVQGDQPRLYELAEQRAASFAETVRDDFWWNSEDWQNASVRGALEEYFFYVLLSRIPAPRSRSSGGLDGTGGSASAPARLVWPGEIHFELDAVEATKREV